jgi:AcrR family transcriptional regulator
MAERRSAILEAAARLFEHYGYPKTTMADVAREAGIGVGTVYLEFDSKEAIVQELSRSTHAGVLEAMRAADRGSDDAKRLTAVLVARTRAFLELQNKGQHACDLVLCDVKAKTEGIRTAHRSFHEAELALLEEIVRRGQRAGRFAATDATRTAALIKRAFASLSPPWIFASDEDDKLGLTQQLCALILDGVVTRVARATSETAPARAQTKARARRNRLG